jgi:hypothetical protein
MDFWSVRVEWTTPEPLTDDQIGRLAAGLEPYSASIGVERNGNPSAQLAVEARTIRQAFDVAVRAVEATCKALGVPCKVVGVDVATWAEFERRLAEPSIPPVVGLAEIGDMLGVSRQRAGQLVQTYPDRLTEVDRTSNGPLFLKSQVEVFARTWERKRTGRPPKPRA